MFIRPDYHHFLFLEDVDFVINTKDVDALCCVELMKPICENYTISTFENYNKRDRPVLGINLSPPTNTQNSRIICSFSIESEDVYDDSTVVLVDDITTAEYHRNIIPTWCAFKMLETLNILELKHAHLTAMVVYYYYMMNLIDYEEYLIHIKEIQLLFPEIVLHEHLYGYLFGTSSLYTSLRYTPHLFYYLKWHKTEQIARLLCAKAGISLVYSKTNKSDDMSMIYKFVNKAQEHPHNIDKNHLLIHCIKCNKLRNMDMALHALVLLDHPWMSKDLIKSINNTVPKSISLMESYLEMICNSFGLVLQQKLLKYLPAREGITMANCDVAYAFLDHIQLVEDTTIFEQIGPFGLRWLCSILANVYEVPIMLIAPYKDSTQMLITCSDPLSRVKGYYQSGNIYTIIAAIYEKEPMGYGMYLMENRQEVMEFKEQLGMRMRAYAYEEPEE